MRICTPYNRPYSHYDPYSRYAEQPWPYYRIRPSEYRPDYDKSELMQQDALTLAQMLRPVRIAEDATLAEQVFGNQTRQQRLSLEHVGNLVNERKKIHKALLKDIERRHMEIQKQLFGAQLHAKLDNHGRELKLERLLLQLDEQRRREELEFWRDTAKLRDQIFDTAKEYQALRHRISLLEGPESEAQYDA